jgi:hypothetical protein
MKLLTVGDSFTYGEELADRTLAWPYLLGKKINSQITNLGKPGASNNKILRNVLENADEFDLVIVAWSHFARIEFSDENGTYDVWPGNRGNMFFDNLAYRKELLDFITKHHNDLYLYSQNLINVILLQNYLKQHNKKYIMLDSFNECYNPELPKEKLRQLVSHLVDQVDSKYFIGWPTETMMEWTFGTPRGSRGHFLEDGHRIVADKVYEYIRYLGWVS